MLVRSLVSLGSLGLALALPGSLRSRDSATTFSSQQPQFSGDVTSCKGYSVDSVNPTSTGGLLASLSILSNCSAYGNDISQLTLSVEYQTSTRLHVHIYDTDLHQYQLDDSVLPRPTGDLSAGDAAAQSDMMFNYTQSPFEFWITRKADNAILFDTRAANIPTYNDEVEIEGKPSNYTLMPGHSLVFEDQYLQLSSALPVGANIYGLGEAVSGSGYRRNSSGAVQTMWARDVADPVDENMYGIHPMYMEVRWDNSSSKSTAHGAFLLNSHGMDIVLRDGVIQYRAIGGTLDFYFMSGPTPNAVAEQYANTVGLPQVMPFWSFGFHLCRWGYTSINETRQNVMSMKEAGIPLETQWNDIDWMRRYREFQFDQNYAPDEYKAFVDELHSNNQHYINIIDAAIGLVYNSSDTYDVYTRGHELGVWMHNPDKTEYVGSVWPGYTVFPDWFNPQMEQVWYEAFYNFSQVVDFDGIWLDMNEPSSFVTGTQANSTLQLNQTLLNPSSYPNPPPSMPTEWPEGYDNFTSGISGNLTIDGKLTYGANGTRPAATDTALKRSFDLDLAQRKVDERLSLQRRNSELESRQNGPDISPVPFVENPAYPIRNGNGALDVRTVDPNVVHANGIQEYHVHNVWGTMEEITTNAVISKLKPGTRPFIVGRSTFAGVGRKTAHWLGDNFSTWAYMKRSIQGVLQFNLFAIPMVGPDTCGFNGNTDEELCNRWMQLSAFYPFYRNHNTKGALSQEPYRWDTVAEASIIAINARYSLLPYWETLFAEAACSGTPPVRALFHEFDNPAYYDIDSQFLVGSSILVTPQLQPNQSTVMGTFPSADGVTWTNFFTHEKLDTSGGEMVEVDAPLSTIPVHVRSGSVILTQSDVQYTLTDTRSAGYGLLVVLDGKGYAEGTAKIDDGVSLPVTSQSCINFVASSWSCLNSTTSGNYNISTQLTEITIIGVTQAPAEGSVTLNGQAVSNVTYIAATNEVVVSGLQGDLNSAWELKW